MSGRDYLAFEEAQRMKTNLEEAMKILGLPRYAFHELASKRQIPFRRIDGVVVFDLDELRRFRVELDRVSWNEAVCRLRGPMPDHMVTAPEPLPEPVVDEPPPSLLERVTGWLS